MALITRHIPPATPEQIEASLARAAQECARLGITTIHDAGIDNSPSKPTAASSPRNSFR